MLFASFDFLLFAVPVILAFWALRGRPGARTVMLLLASYFFYMASAKPPEGEISPPWYFAGLLVASTFLDYFASLRIHRHTPALGSSDAAVAAAARRARAMWLWISLVGNLGLLAYFKYVDFFMAATIDVLKVVLPGSFGDAVAPALAPILPIGISFYTFQSLSYTIDVWRQRLTPEPSFRKFALFVVFFPQLVAGPIVRANEFLPQLHRKPRVSASEIEWALFRIAKGLLKKVVLGDFIAVYFTDIVFDSPGDYTSLENLLALYAFTLQIYADFSGYSDIAIGVAKLMGFEMPENFDRPYQALDVGEFWRRWHMTLSTWLRDYLFFPLGGSKGSNARTYFNLWATMFLVGMWHGASWNFVVYSNLQGGAVLFNRWNRLRSRTLAAKLALWLLVWPLFGALMYGFALLVLALSIERAAMFAGIAAFLFALIVGLPEAPRKPGQPRRWLIPIHVLLTFHFATLTRVFFRSDDLEHARAMIGKLLAFEPHGFREGLFRIQALHDWLREHFADASGTVWFELVDRFAEHGLLYLLIGGILYHFTPRRWVDELLLARFRKLPGWALGLLFAAISLLLMHLLDGPRANIYFSF
jgi:D-alanyl-lipoteichoic acid acyltransferase DltB (MBOAT superfamily)